MYGVVSTLNEPHHQQTIQLWSAMWQQFGIGLPTPTAIPHFSYHVAPIYDLDACKQVLLETAVSTPPFIVKTTGIGIFPGEKPVVYMPVTRNPALTALHTQLTSRLDAIAQASLEYYAPNSWFPHITLGQRDISPAQLGPLVTWLNSQPLAWEIQVTNLIFMHAEGEKLTPLHQVTLQA